MSDDDHSPISVKDAKRLFADWKRAPALVLAVSGGPDSVALMWLMARWRRALARGPRLLAVTVDHGLRLEAAREARDVKRLAQSLELEHRTMRWKGDKPKTGVPAAARRCAISPAGAGRAQCRRHAYPDRSYPRRPGRDAVDAAVARQRHCGPRGDGAPERARRRDARASVPGRFQIATPRDAAQGRRSPSPTIRPTAIPPSRDRGCARCCLSLRPRAATPAVWRGWPRGSARANAAVEVLVDGAERYLALTGRGTSHHPHGMAFDAEAFAACRRRSGFGS